MEIENEVKWQVEHGYRLLWVKPCSWKALTPDGATVKCVIECTKENKGELSSAILLFKEASQ
jgi:hypothetical protein